MANEDYVPNILTIKVVGGKMHIGQLDGKDVGDKIEATLISEISLDINSLEATSIYTKDNHYTLQLQFPSFVIHIGTANNEDTLSSIADNLWEAKKIGVVVHKTMVFSIGTKVDDATKVDLKDYLNPSGLAIMSEEDPNDIKKKVTSGKY